MNRRKPPLVLPGVVLGTLVFGMALVGFYLLRTPREQWTVVEQLIYGISGATGGALVGALVGLVRRGL